jgi:hypothetical protein
MYNEFAVNNSELNNKSDNWTKIGSKFKELANDSLFYFGIFLTAIFLLHSLVYFSGTASELNIGINEVIVSFIGFVNIFSIKLLKNTFSK